MPHDPIGRYPRRECLGIMHALSAAKAAFLRRLAIASDDLIAAHWLEVEKIAKALLEEKTLSGTRVRELISRGTIVVTPAPKRRPSPNSIQAWRLAIRLTSGSRCAGGHP